MDALGGMIRQAGQHVGELSLWIEVVELGRGDEGDSTWVHRITGEKRARHACLIEFVDKLWQPLNCKLVDEGRSEWQVSIQIVACLRLKNRRPLAVAARRVLPS